MIPTDSSPNKNGCFHKEAIEGFLQIEIWLCCHVFSRNSRGVKQTKGRTWKREECCTMIQECCHRTCALYFVAYLNLLSSNL